MYLHNRRYQVPQQWHVDAESELRAMLSRERSRNSELEAKLADLRDLFTAIAQQEEFDRVMGGEGA